MLKVYVKIFRTLLFLNSEMDLVHVWYIDPTFYAVQSPPHYMTLRSRSWTLLSFTYKPHPHYMTLRSRSWTLLKFYIQVFTCKARQQHIRSQYDYGSKNLWTVWRLTQWAALAFGFILYKWSWKTSIYPYLNSQASNINFKICILHLKFIVPFCYFHSLLEGFQLPGS